MYGWKAAIWPGLSGKKAHLRRVELSGCRVVGFRLSNASLEDVQISRCNAELARFYQQQRPAPSGYPAG